MTTALAHLCRAVGRHAHVADAVVALAVFAATLVTAFTGRSAGGDWSVATVAAALGCGALAVRRLRPLVALAVSAPAAEVFLVESGSDSGVLILLAPLIALYTVADMVERRRALFLGSGAVAALALVHAVHRPALLGPQNLAFIALGGLAIAAGDSSRNRRAYLAEAEGRASRAEREREQDARRRIAEERLRIARDLHDAVGHQLALISVQSNVAGQALDQDTASAREAIGHVKSASRRALGELRDTVSLLRQPGDAIAPTAIPAPGLDGLADLLASLTASGLDIDRRIEGAVVPLAPAADLTAYRVIQESLTNVYKHSDTRRARLTLTYDSDRLRITVDDLGGPGDVPRPVGSAGRHGIVGMRERVLALGGHFSAGPRADGAFQVAAALPYQPLDLAAENRP
ncbi:MULTISPECIES: sensor histidine kinase [unclassified Streptomyces]|uniref:sensor histidine kinase n=1 Tax=unclassified Streptomyces TaxID=2593676 RepID=UPI002E81D20D|nr:sensor histidine kinase [Streptomyces sp. NBC_00589]WTI35035.1 sensor histidine kinase [Streptomyces sp. NBC_00775]WUB31291.1 sensor histidine kinase [Streptomyces sp. NBC_00589]